jgi:hypothetical protein
MQQVEHRSPIEVGRRDAGVDDAPHDAISRDVRDRRLSHRACQRIVAT